MPRELEGALKGAGTGYTVGGPVGAAIGGGIGFLTGLFSPSEDSIRQERFQQFLRILAKLKGDAVQQAFQRASGLMQQATSGARRRAGAAGIGANAEDLILPAQGQAARIGGQMVSDVSHSFDQERLRAEADFQNRPIEPDALDYLTEAAGVVAQQFNFEKYLKTLSTPNTPTTASTIGGILPSTLQNYQLPNVDVTKIFAEKKGHGVPLGGSITPLSPSKPSTSELFNLNSDRTMFDRLDDNNYDMMQRAPRFSIPSYEEEPYMSWMRGGN